jgi:peroxiredoxin Q/BCP
MASNKRMIGQPLPTFDLASSAGGSITNADLIGKWTVIFFYPKDDSPGCIVQSCQFRDDYSQYEKLGAQLFGVSMDNVESHQKFALKHRLPFPLLADAKGVLRRELQIAKSLGILPGRVTIIVDDNGIIRKIYNSQLRFKQHSKVALKFLHSNI